MGFKSGPATFQLVEACPRRRRPSCPEPPAPAASLYLRAGPPAWGGQKQPRYL